MSSYAVYMLCHHPSGDDGVVSAGHAVPQHRQLRLDCVTTYTAYEHTIQQIILLVFYILTQIFKPVICNLTFYMCKLFWLSV